MLDQRAVGKFWKNPVALASVGILLVISIAVIVGPLLLPASYAEPGPLSFAPPSLQHPFGTDLNGRDLLYRVLAGGRISMSPSTHLGNRHVSLRTDRQRVKPRCAVAQMRLLAAVT